MIPVAQITSQEYCSTYITRSFLRHILSLKVKLKVVCYSLISFAVSIWLQQPDHPIQSILPQINLNSMPKRTKQKQKSQYLRKSFGAHKHVLNANCLLLKSYSYLNYSFNHL